MDDESGPMGSLGGSTCCSSALLVIPAPSARVQTFFPRRDGLAERFFDVTSGNGTVLCHHVQHKREIFPIFGAHLHLLVRGHMIHSQYSHMSQLWRISLSGDLSIVYNCQIATPIFTCQSPKANGHRGKTIHKEIDIPKMGDRKDKKTRENEAMNHGVLGCSWMF